MGCYPYKILKTLTSRTFTLEHATIIENKGDGVIGVGSVVTIAYDEDDTEEYTIVGTNEADPF